MKLTDKLFLKELNNTIANRSLLKRWKRAYYLKERKENPMQYMVRMSSYVNNT